MTMRRFESHNGLGEGIEFLSDDDPCVIERKTKFPSRVKVPTERHLIVKSGLHSRKLGAWTTLGFGFRVPIFTWTHEERRTCPPNLPCHRYCYMDQTPFADRWVIGPEFYQHGERHLKMLCRKHPDGLLVRVNTGGDVLDLEYADWLARVAEENAQVYLWLYTAHAPTSDTGYRLLLAMDRIGWRRFNVRFSGQRGDGSADVITEIPPTKKLDGMLVCPAMVPDPQRPGKFRKENCATCGACWLSRVGILFPLHRKFELSSLSVERSA